MQYPHNSHDRNTVPRPHFPISLPSVQLEIVQGQARNRVRQIQERAYLFGSSDQCDLVLRDASVEEVQGYLLNTPQGVWVRQLGRQTTLSVNGRPVRCMLLLDKDRLRVGPFEFRVHIQSVTGAEQTVPVGVSDRPTMRSMPSVATFPEATRASSTEVSRGRRVDSPQGMVPAPKFLRRATAVSRGTQHAAVDPPSWKHMSHELLVD